MNPLINSFNKEEVISTFCQETGIKKIKAFIKNEDTGELRVYCQASSKYRIPKGWTNVKSGVLEVGKYPDLLKPDNFLKLLNCHWNIFGNFGMYRAIDYESFPINYLITRTKAIQTCRSLGGGEMLSLYIGALKEISFDYEVEIC